MNNAVSRFWQEYHLLIFIKNFIHDNTSRLKQKHERFLHTFFEVYLEMFLYTSLDIIREL